MPSLIDAIDATILYLLQNLQLCFDLVDWKILVNHITVAVADVEADNGVIHVIDEVLIP